MRVIWMMVAFGLWALTACGPRSSSAKDAAVNRRDGVVPRDGSNPGSDGSTLGPDAIVPQGDAATPGPDAAVSQVAYCLPACGTAAECNLGSAPYDSDNYACLGGACHYQGCVSDTECQSLGNYRCRQPAGYVMPLCLPACSTVSDCDLGSAPYSPDNYSCTGEVCVYTGCVSDTECQTLGDNVCRTQPNSTVPYCLPACSTSADCNLGSAPYDSDNYDCLGGVCVYSGCNSLAECQAMGSYVCVIGTSPLLF